jgi:hypothetical protein
MVGARVRYHSGDYDLHVEGHGVLTWLDGEVFVAPTSVLGAAGVAELRRALRRCGGEEPFELCASDDEMEDYGRAKIYARDASRRPVFLEWDGEQLAVKFFVETVATTTAHEAEDAAAAAALRFHGRLLSLDWIQQKSTAWGELTFELPTRGRIVGELLADGDEILKLIEATLAGDIDAATTADLIRGGAASVLLGLYESHWLEAKSAPYRVDEASEQFELAKDVAAMSNATGGLIVLGAKTKTRSSGDEIVQINGCTPEAVSPRQYRHIINSRLYPRPQGVRITVVPHGDRKITLIEIAEESRERRPILVKGASGGPRSQGLGFTWPIRSGDQTIGPSIEEIHALIRAGHLSLTGPRLVEDQPRCSGS